MMQYKGYRARVTFDEDAETFHGTVLHLRDVITFEADSVAGLKREFRNSVDDYLAFCKELGREPERPLSGRFLLRMDPDLHRDATSAAELAGASLNAWICDRLREAAGARLPVRRRARSGAA
ncbi:MAG TPA: type II toxin-antitoxin system HicB family antitoxin [Longimicrobiales bacterium]|nr:type II toxin-antitoxin system HicB family antitoxin [Longimicrobiales bacterium]